MARPAETKTVNSPAALCRQPRDGAEKLRIKRLQQQNRAVTKGSGFQSFPAMYGIIRSTHRVRSVNEIG
jgi:hypothetical protein